MFQLVTTFGRTYLFAVAALLIGTGLCIAHRIDGVGFVTLVIALTGVVAGRAVAEDRVPPTPAIGPDAPKVG